MIAQSLKSLGWQCTKQPMKRDGRTSRYYFQENIEKLDGDISFAYLKVSDEIGTRMDPHPHQDTADQEDLKSINHRFLKARADKETALSKTRAVETMTASHRESHLGLQLAKERRDYVSIADVIRDWEVALTHLRISLYTMPNKFSARWASMDSESQIEDEMRHELDVICDRLAVAGQDVATDDEDGQFQTKEKIKKVDSSTPQ